MLTLFIQHIFHSTDRIVYRQFWFGACRLTDVQPSYAGALMDLETDTGPGISRTAAAMLAVCDSGGGRSRKWEDPSFDRLSQQITPRNLAKQCLK